MKKLMQSIGLLLIGLVFLLPVSMAQEMQATSSSKASAQSSGMSVVGLKFRQLGESFNDFAFKVKSGLTFSQESKIELLQERNDELQARQENWVQTKQDATANFNANMTAEQKQKILAVLKSEHQAIIRNHIETTNQFREIQLNARAKGNARVEEKARAAAEESEVHEGLLGLFIDIDSSADAGSKGRHLDLNDGVHANITSTQAQAIVQEELGFQTSSVKTVVKDNTRFYVVTGHETKTNGDYSMTRNFEVWVHADTGLITSVYMDTRIETNARIASSASSSTQGRSSQTSSSNSGVGIGISADASVNSQASNHGPSASISASSGVSSGAGVSGSGGASGSANGNLGVSIG